MDYDSTFYDNFDALLEGDHQTATLLLKELDFRFSHPLPRAIPSRGRKDIPRTR